MKQFEKEQEKELKTKLEGCDSGDNRTDLTDCTTNDGTAITLSECKCKAKVCKKGQTCTITVNTGACALPNCAKLDESAVSTAPLCKCGTGKCRQDMLCKETENKCSWGTCPNNNNAITTIGCKCGTKAICRKGQ